MGWGCASRSDAKVEPLGPAALPVLIVRAYPRAPAMSAPLVRAPSPDSVPAQHIRGESDSPAAKTAEAGLKAPTATVLAFLALGLCNVVGWLLGGWGTSSDAGAASAATPWRVRVEAALFDGSHFLLAALVAWVLIAAACTARGRLGRSRTANGYARAANLAAVYGVASCLGAWLLPIDLTNYSQRQTFASPAIALALGVALVAGSIPAAVASGWLLRRPWGRLVAGGVLLVAAIVNAVVLPNDYFVMHLFAALSAAGVAASAWTGAKLPSAPTWARRAGWATAVGLALTGVVLQPSARAATTLATSTASVMSLWVARARSAVLQESAATAGDRSNDPWFRHRGEAPDVPPSGAPLLGPSPLVILITIDSLRADVVHSGQYDEKLPTLAALRERAVWFSNARASGTLTKTSLSGMMMGIHFSQQYWVDTGRYYTVGQDETKRFPTFLRQAGVRTINYRSIGWVRNGNILNGFAEDVYVPPPGKHYYTPSKPLFAKLLPRIEALGQEPAFIYAHLSDPHAPYNLGGTKGSPFERYLAEVAVVDKQLRRLVRLLEKTGLMSRTLLIVSADHGEAFGEHDSRTHGTTLYDEVLRVPLLFVFPGATPRRVDEQVTLLDVGPTVLDVFGLPTPGYMMGESLAPFLRGETPVLTRPILAENRLVQAWITRDRKKLIWDTQSGRKELYDLEADPAELDNLADDAEALAQPLADLKGFMETHRLRKEGYRTPYVR